MKSRLRSSEPVHAGLVRLARQEAERLEQFGLALRSADLSGYIHQLRVATKRQRAMWVLLRPWLDRDLYRARVEPLKAAAASLAGDRDRRVMRQALADLAGRDGDARVRRYLQRWHARLQRRDGDATPLDMAPALWQARQALHRNADHLASLDFGLIDDWTLLEPGLQRTWARARKALGEARTAPSGPAYHTWRKWVKRLMFEVRFIRRAWPKRLNKLAARLDKLGSDLGDDHDLYMVARLCAAGSDRIHRRRSGGRGDGPARALAVMIEDESRRVRRRCDRLGRKVFGGKAARFTQRVQRRFERWRQPQPRHAAGPRPGSAAALRSAA